MDQQGEILSSVWAEPCVKNHRLNLSSCRWEREGRGGEGPPRLCGHEVLEIRGRNLLRRFLVFFLSSKPQNPGPAITVTPQGWLPSLQAEPNVPPPLRWFPRCREPSPQEGLVRDVLTPVHLT